VPCSAIFAILHKAANLISRGIVSPDGAFEPG